MIIKIGGTRHVFNRNLQIRHRPRRDPLILDLDGNGISTTPINPVAPLLFDTYGDGVGTATGWLGDSHPAMSLGSSEASALQAALSAFAAAPTRADQQALLDGLLAQWAASSGRHSKHFKYNSTKAPRHADSGSICLPKTLHRTRGTSSCGKTRRLQAWLRRGARRWFEANTGLSPHRTALSSYSNMSNRDIAGAALCVAQ